MGTMMKLRFEGGLEFSVEATVTGAFAVHSTVNQDGTEGDYYTLTHVASGRAIIQGFYTFWDAFSLANKLNAMHVPWNDMPEKVTKENYAQWMTKGQYKKLGALVRKYYRETVWYVEKA